MLFPRDVLVKIFPVMMLACMAAAPAGAAGDYDEMLVFRTYDYVSASTGGTLRSLEDDGVSAGIDLGFTFDFYGNSYSTIYVSANGMVGFDPAVLTGLVPPVVPGDSATPTVIAPFSADLDPSKGGSVYTLAGGVTGKRFFAVEWIAVPLKGKGGTRTFEVILYEEGGEILFQYRALRGGDIIDAATVGSGIENLQGTAPAPAPVLADIVEGVSILFSADALSADSDSDGMPDRFEVFSGLDPAVSDAADDRDGDGLTNIQEFNAGTKANQADTDGDGLEDGPEAGSDPDNPRDSDGNGLLDALETDSDKDGIRDVNISNPKVTAGEDRNKDGSYDPGGNETDATSPDSDGDGYNDAMEISFGSDARDGAVRPVLSGATRVTGTIQDAITAASAGDILYIPTKLDAGGSAAAYAEDLTIDKPVTLIGADPETTFLEGTVTIRAVDVVLNGFTIRNADPAVFIPGDAAADAAATLVNLALKDCANGVWVTDSSSGGAAGMDTRAVLEKITFSVTKPMLVGYAVRVEGLQDAGDAVEIRNSTFSLSGDAGAVLIEGSSNIVLTGVTISSSGKGAVITDGTDVTVDNNVIRNNPGDAIQVKGSSAAVTVNRNTLTDNGGNGVLVTDTAAAAVTANVVTGNDGVGITTELSGAVTNSGNLVSNNTTNYGGSANASETAASEVGASSSGRIQWVSASRIPAAAGGSVAVLDAPDVLIDPLESLFGAQLSIPAGLLSDDALVTLATTSESLPAVPVAFEIAMPAVRLTVHNAVFSGTGTARLTLPVLAGYDPATARVYHLVNGAWEEVTSPSRLRHLQVEPSLPQRVSFDLPAESESTFAVVIDLPLTRTVKRGTGGGCSVGKPERGLLAREGVSLDPFLWVLPVFFLMRKRRQNRLV